MKKVLVVDDEPGTRMMLREFLEARGCTVIEAADGDESLLIARCEKPDCITMDVQMERIEGDRAAAVLRVDPGTCAIPVILYTGVDTHRVLSFMKLDEKMRLVKKPGNLDALWKAVEELTT